MQLTYHNQNHTTNFFYHLVCFLKLPLDIMKWCDWKSRVCGFAPWMNLSKYAFVLAISWITGVALSQIPEYFTVTRIVTFVVLWGMIICISCFVIISGWSKWRGRREDLDNIWKQTGEALGLTLTLTPFTRTLTGTYQGVFVDVTDKYAGPSSIMGRNLAIAGRMAGVTVRSGGPKNHLDISSSFSTAIFRKKGWPEDITNLPELLQQRVRNILHHAGKIFLLSISNGSTRFVQEAYVSDSDAQDSLDLPTFPLKELIEAHLMIYHGCIR